MVFATCLKDFFLPMLSSSSSVEIFFQTEVSTKSLRGRQYFRAYHGNLTSPMVAKISPLYFHRALGIKCFLWLDPFLFKCWLFIFSSWNVLSDEELAKKWRKQLAPKQSGKLSEIPHAPIGQGLDKGWEEGISQKILTTNVVRNWTVR